MAVFMIGILITIFMRPPLAVLGQDKLHQQVISMRDYGISQAEARGDYKCCIKPPCTMCYMEGNKWNYGQAGKCFCDDFVARGEEPCPQCKNGLVKDTGSACLIQSEICDETEEIDTTSI